MGFHDFLGQLWREHSPSKKAQLLSIRTKVQPMRNVEQFSRSIYRETREYPPISNEIARNPVSFGVGEKTLMWPFREKVDSADRKTEAKSQGMRCVTLPPKCPRLWGESVLVMPLSGACCK